MFDLPRITLTLCLCSTVLTGCQRDEPATYLPKSGSWTYENQTLVSDTCEANSLPDSQGMIYVDHDAGDSFQIELGENDVTCEIDGTDFYCTEWVLDSEVEGFDAVIRLSVTWEGEFFSSTRAKGEEITRRTCIGEACPLVEMFVMVPCTRIVSFEATAL